VALLPSAQYSSLNPEKRQLKEYMKSSSVSLTEGKDSAIRTMVTFFTLGIIIIKIILVHEEVNPSSSLLP